MRQFLVNEFGESLGNRIYDLQQRKLQAMLGMTMGKSNNQMRTLKKTILPRISLYKVLQEELDDQKKAYDIVEKYMFTVVGPKLNKQYSMLERIPGFFYIFRRLMVSMIIKSDNWAVKIIKNDNTSVEYNITKCLWNDACVESSCPEFCRIFCDTDHVIYDSMKKIKFIRKGTLGTGNKFCDFCYLNKKKTERV